MIQVQRSRRGPRRLTRLAAAVLAVTLVAGCGSDDDAASGTSAPSESTATTTAVSPSATAAPTTEDASDTTSAPTTDNATDISTAATTGESTGETDESTPAVDPYAPQPLPTKTHITVSIAAPVSVYTQFLVAHYFKEFEKENLDVEVVVVPPADALTQLGSGGVDFLLTSFQVSVLNAIAQGQNIKLIAPLFTGTGGNPDGLYIRKELAPEAPANLSGKTFGSTISPFIGGAPTLVLGDFLASGGVDISDVKGLQVPRDGFVAALTNGQIDGVWMTAPIDLTQVEPVATRVAVANDDESLSGTFIGPSMIDGDPAVVEAYLRAIARTERDYLQGEYFNNPDVVTAMTTETGAPATAFAPGTELEFSAKLKLPPAEPMDRLQKYLLTAPGNQLAFDAPFPYEQLVDTSYVDALALG